MKTVSTDLFQLIKSMTKQEKRYFKLQAGRHGRGAQNNYLLLFDAIDGQKVYDEQKIKQKFKQQAFTRQLHVAKNYLYKLILNSLRQYTENKAEDQFPILIRNARILFDKGLYEQSEKTLQKAKKLAIEQESFLQILEACKWEHHFIHRHNNFKQLERYVDVDFQRELDFLDRYKNFLQFQRLNNRVFLSYWKKGNVRNQAEKEALEALFREELYQEEGNAQSFSARFFYHNAHFTYHFLAENLEQCYHHISQTVRMFEDLEANQLKHKSIRQYSSALINQYAVQQKLGLFDQALQSLRKLRQLPANSLDQKTQLFIRSYNLEIDLYLYTGQFTTGLDNLEKFEKELDQYHNYIDIQQRLGLYYNLAYIHFGARDYNRSLDWINLLLNEPDLKLREDIHCFGRILNLFIHYELGNDQLLEYIVQSTYRFLSKRKRLYKVESIILNFLKKHPNWITHHTIHKAFTELHKDLAVLLDDAYEKKAFEYFDFLSWLESKTGHLGFEEVVQSKLLEVKL